MLRKYFYHNLSPILAPLSHWFVGSPASKADVARILIGRRSLTKLLALGGHAIVHVARIKCFPCLPI